MNNEFATTYGEADDHHRPRMTPRQDESLILAKNTLNIGTLNTRTLAKPGKIDLVLKEIDRYKWDIVGMEPHPWYHFSTVGTY